MDEDERLVQALIVAVATVAAAVLIGAVILRVF